MSQDFNKVKREIREQKMKFVNQADLNYKVFVRGWELNKTYHHNVAADWVKKRIEIYFSLELKNTLLRFKCYHDDCTKKDRDMVH